MRPFAAWLRTWGFYSEAVLATVAGLSMILALQETRELLVAALVNFGVWLVANFHSGPAVTSPLPQQVRRVAKGVLVPLALAGLLVGFVGVSSDVVPVVALAVGSAAVVSAICRTLRWRLQSPIRVLIVGDSMAIAQAAAKWSRGGPVRAVAAVLAEPDRDDVPADIMGLPVYSGIAAAPELVSSFKADLVVVSPGPGFTSTDFRRLAWRLEHADAAIGVMGVLDSVSPHRITPGSMMGATVIDVRLPRAPMIVDRFKSVADRLGAALLLVVASPLLLAMALAVRLDSPGKALFTQTRVGRNGRHFKLYKIRTMVKDAEEVKSGLLAENEHDGVLFKIRRDPRITRVGHLLRKSSLDELPQLVNVLRGEMSLVGPRPALPSEVEVMDSDTLRRLAVRPGITGLWQVSGRSDLSGEQSQALDTYYADNWSLVGDAGILLRTVRAVLGGKGAY